MPVSRNCFLTFTSKHKIQSMRTNWNTMNLTVKNFFLLQESVSNSRSDQLKKALRSVPDWAQIKVCGVPIRAHGL